METIKRIIGGKTYNVERGLARSIRNADDGRGGYSNSYIQVFHDKSTDELWGTYHNSIGRNSWTEYHDDDIDSLGFFADKNFVLEDLFRDR